MELVCIVPVAMQHLAEPTEVVWREVFPVKVNVARESMSEALTIEVRKTVHSSQVAFSIAVDLSDTPEAHLHALSDEDVIAEYMCSSLRVDVSFPEGSIHCRAGQLRLFLLELSKCDVQDGLLVLPNCKCPMFEFEQRSFIAVRDCYAVLFNCIFNQKTKVRVALTGTPGIGKTCFLIYFLWRLIDSGLSSSDKYPQILFHDKGRDRFVLHDDGSVHPLIDQPGYAQAQRNHPDMWYLVDSVAPELTGYMNILLVASHTRDLIKHHYKDAIPFGTLYMPSWTDYEIENLIALNRDSPVVRKNQEKFGNIPRSLFTSLGDSLAEVEEDWEEAVGSFSHKALFSAFFGSGKDAKNIHHLVHVEVPEWNKIDPNTGLPKHDFWTMYLKFASQMSQDAIVTNLCEVRPHDLKSLLDDAAGASIDAPLCRIIFEAYAFRVMRNSSNYPLRARVLVRNGDITAPIGEFRPYCGTNLRYTEFETGPEIIFSSMPKNTLCQARSKDHTGVNGFCADGIINLTVKAEQVIVMNDELTALVERGVKESWFRVYDSSRNAIGYLFFVPWYAFGRLERLQPVRRESNAHVDRTNLRPLCFELFQIAVEIPIP